MVGSGYQPHGSSTTTYSEAVITALFGTLKLNIKLVEPLMLELEESISIISIADWEETKAPLAVSATTPNSS
jgi:hypothetical protein